MASISILVSTVGELCASPVILSYITKLSPQRLVSSIMGIYFAAIGIGNKLAGTIGQNSEKLEKNLFYRYHIRMCIIVGFTVILFSRKLSKLSHGLDN